MSTQVSDIPIGNALFNKNRRAVLGLLFSHPEEAFYLRQIVRACGGGVGAVQRELKLLARAGIIRRTVRGRQVYFQADEACPVFEELKGIMVKTAGVADVLRTALAPLADRILVAFVFGSVARGRQREGSDVDLAIVGDVDFSEVVHSLSAAQERLKREVNPVVYSRKEFQSKVRAGHYFVRSVLKKDKVFLIGDQDDLAGLAAKRVARGA